MSKNEQVSLITSELLRDYQNKTPLKLKVIDVFLGYVLLTGIVQFVYCALVGTFPFNSFLSGFVSTVATFVLTVSLRIQVDPANSFKGISHERAFADYVFCNIVLHLLVMNFIG